MKYLYEERKITASGHETTDTDPGIATSKDDYSLETYILGTDHYQIELGATGLARAAVLLDRVHAATCQCRVLRVSRYGYKRCVSLAIRNSMNVSHCSVR